MAPINLFANYHFQYSTSRPVTRAGTAYWMVIAHLEDFGAIPIHGSGPLERDVKWPEHNFNGPCRLLTEAEHLEFLRIHHPATYEFYIEQQNAALTSAAL